MILVISSLTKAQDGGRSLQDVTSETVTVCATQAEAIEKLEAQEFSAVVFDQLLLDTEPDDGEMVLKHLGTAVPVYLNFAVSSAARVARELRSALRRREREMLAARRDAEQALRHELKETATALLLSCEMALQVPDLPPPAEAKMQTVEALAREMSGKLGVEG